MAAAQSEDSLGNGQYSPFMTQMRDIYKYMDDLGGNKSPHGAQCSTNR